MEVLRKSCIRFILSEPQSARIASSQHSERRHVLNCIATRPAAALYAQGASQRGFAAARLRPRDVALLCSLVIARLKTSRRRLGLQILAVSW